jgi:hypothetical protein
MSFRVLFREKYKVLENLAGSISSEASILSVKVLYGEHAYSMLSRVYQKFTFTAQTMLSKSSKRG